MAAAGIIFTTPEGLALFVKRAAGSDHAGTWAFPGGSIEGDETAEAAARREAFEEIGHETQGNVSEIHHEEDDENPFTTFHNGIDGPFLPQLNDEHTAYAWAPLIDPPSPLHPGVSKTIDDMEEYDKLPMATDMAFDRAVYMPLRIRDKVFVAFDRASVRRDDADGRLHVDMTNISKANVCPYLGKEIPNWQALGLDADKIYKLYRDPEELERAAPTFNNLPVLDEHVEVNSADHRPEHIIGTTGTDATFDHPFLRNSMAFWTDQAKDDIQSMRKKELSSAYRYRADMTPGTSPEGDAYDGVMRDIVGNHVALVEEGRAGPDVVVGDSTKELKMGKIKISQKAMMTRGALAAFIQPLLAKDKKLPALTPLLLGLDAKNFASKKSALTLALDKAIKPLLAKDASAAGLSTLLDSLEAAPVKDDADPMDDITLDAPDDPKDPGVVKVDKPDPMEAVMAFLQGKLAPEDLAQLETLIGGAAPAPGAQDDPPPFKGKPEVGGNMVGDNAEEDKEMIDKPAMDAALAKERKETLAEASKNFNAIREAERAVRPYIGEVTKAFDSAGDVYKSTLEALKVDVTGVDPSAYPAMLKLVPVPGAPVSKFDPTKPLGMDAAATAGFEGRFKNASRIRSL
jgi:8-oxo-dGTP pyrophosphatase MutT (NUDIX family)